MHFKLYNGDYSGGLAFTGRASARLLLVADTGQGAVHVIDVLHKVHVGYVGGLGSIVGPKGVAATCDMAAVTSWEWYNRGDHVVRLFTGEGAAWTPVRVLGGGFGYPGPGHGQMNCPEGLRFTRDGTAVVVADMGNMRVSKFRVRDGSLDKHVATGLLEPHDVEECQGGWIVACRGSNTLEFVGDADSAHTGPALPRASLGRWPSSPIQFSRPSSLALVPGLGLVVRELGSVKVFSVTAANESGTVARPCSSVLGAHLRHGVR